jgi:hypothetical protein
MMTPANFVPQPGFPSTMAEMPWNERGSRWFFAHDRLSLSQLLEDSFQIAWEYLERTGELGDSVAASRFLSDVIETMIHRDQRSRLALANRAISAYQRFRSSDNAGSERVRSSA